VHVGSVHIPRHLMVSKSDFVMLGAYELCSLMLCVVGLQRTLAQAPCVTHTGALLMSGARVV
jgi:hypothetical protein